MPDATLHPDHLRLLSIARSAFEARDDTTTWRDNTAKAISVHGHWCDKLWQELERQVISAGDEAKVLEHPSLEVRRRARQMRARIVAAAQRGVIDALEGIASGSLDEEFWLESDLE